MVPGRPSAQLQRPGVHGPGFDPAPGPELDGSGDVATAPPTPGRGSLHGREASVDVVLASSAPPSASGPVRFAADDPHAPHTRIANAAIANVAVFTRSPRRASA